jgi:hypothetical protein
MPRVIASVPTTHHRQAGVPTPTIGSVFSGPQTPKTVKDLFVRKTGSDNNGGSSSTTSPERTGADGVTNGTTTFTAATGAFVAGDVNKLINIVTKGRYRIVGFTNSTTVTLSGSPSSGSSLTWNLGGAVLTIGALLANANAAVLGGDRIWIGAGTYREVVTVSVTPTFELQVNGDVDGRMTGDSGEIVWTPFTTDDKTAAGARPLDLNGKNFLTLQRLSFVAGITAPQWIRGDVLASTNITISDCAFLFGGVASPQVKVLVAAGVPANWLVERCSFLGAMANSGYGLFQAVLTRHTSDYDASISVRNCWMIGGGTHVVYVASTGAGSGLGGGVRVFNCTLLGMGCVVTADANLSITIPCVVENCILITGGTALTATTAGQIVENNNAFQANTPRTNVVVSPSSITAYSLRLEIGQAIAAGRRARAFLEPAENSPVSDFGATGNMPGDDLLGSARPTRPQSAVGPMERANTWARETVTVRTGANALSITGPGYHDFDIPVAASATTVSVYMRFDATYAGPRPQLQILGSSESGVPSEYKPMIGPSGTWEQLSYTFTPTAVGIVTARLISNDTNGAGKAFADDFAVA